MSRKILIASGGTGGHIFPAVTLAETLKEKLPDLNICLAGHGLDNNPFLKNTSFSLHTYSASPLSLSNPLKTLFQGLKITSGVLECLWFLQQNPFDLLVSFGSYHTFPLLIAAHLKQVPFILHEANAIPGRVNRWMSGQAKVTCVQFPCAKASLQGTLQEALLPLRITPPSLFWQRLKEEYGFEEQRLCLFIHGGSQGALGLNQKLQTILPHLANTFPPLQIIHLVGRQHDVFVSYQKLYQQLGLPHYLAPFSDDMPSLWAQADLSICRAGAGTLREMIYHEVPSILVPYPFAQDQHQLANAKFMSQRVGGGLLLPENHLSKESLSYLFERLLMNKRTTLRAMKQALRAYKKKTEDKTLLQVILKELTV